LLDPIRAEVEAAGMDYEEFKRLPIEPWQTYLATAFFGGIGLFALYQGLTIRIGGLPAYLWVGAGAACFTLGTALLWARDIRSWRSIAVLQVLLGCVVGALAWYASGDAAGKWGGIIGAIIAVADGLKNLRELTIRQAKGADR
jgi:hypothetical protein